MGALHLPYAYCFTGAAAARVLPTAPTAATLCAIADAAAAGAPALVFAGSPACDHIAALASAAGIGIVEVEITPELAVSAGGRGVVEAVASALRVRVQDGTMGNGMRAWEW